MSNTYKKIVPHPLNQTEWAWAIRDAEGLNFNEKALLWYFSTRWSEDGEIFPSLSRIAKDLSSSKDRIIKTLKAATGHGWLKVTHRLAGPGDNDSNLYQLRLPDGLGALYEVTEGKEDTARYLGVVANSDHLVANSDKGSRQNRQGLSEIQTRVVAKTDTKKNIEEQPRSRTTQDDKGTRSLLLTRTKVDKDFSLDDKDFDLDALVSDLSSESPSVSEPSPKFVPPPEYHSEYVAGIIARTKERERRNEES